MSVEVTHAFVAGVLAAGHLVVGLFFLRFFARTRDRLFLAFAVAFWLMAVNQAAGAYLGDAEDRQAAVYLLRLAAFGLIIAAIVLKNLRGRGPGRRRGGGLPKT